MSTRNAILGLLSIKPMHGYEMKQYYEQSISYAWSLNYGQLYPLLKKLEKEGLVARETVTQENRPDKIVYRTTEAGKKELVKWIETPILKRQAKDEFYLKMPFLNNVDTETALKFIDNQRAVTEQEIEKLKHIKKTMGDRMPLFLGLYLESGLMHFATDIEWLKLCRERVLATDANKK